MTQEDKELLLKDLCARLPYGVVIQTWYGKRINIKCISVNVYTNVVELDIPEDDDAKVFIDNVKPYLFPISSMTEEQRKELRKIMDFVEATFMNACCKGGFTLSFTNLTDWLNANHFDYRGLIPKGLAIDATGLGVYENNA